MNEKNHPIAIIRGERFYTVMSSWVQTESKIFTTPALRKPKGLVFAEQSVFAIFARSEVGEELAIYDIGGFWMASKPDDFVRFCKSTGWFEMEPAPTPVVLGNDGTFRGEPVN